MKHLKIFETEAEFKTAKPTLEDPWVTLTEDDEKVHYKVNPLFKITMDDEYDDKALIPLTAKKQDIDEDTVWSHNLASDVATLDGTTLRFLKHYEGTVKITAIAGEYSDEKTITINCSAVPDQVTYTVVTAPSVVTVNWDDTTADLSFVGKIVASYSDGHKPSEETQSTYNFTAEFPQNPAGSYPTVNTEMVDLGLPSGLKWAKCNLFAQDETDYGWYFQWADTDGYPTAGESTIDRTGKYDWEGHDVAWTVKQKNQLSKVFNWANYKYCNGSQNTLTKYNTSTSYGENPDNKTIMEAMDDAAVRFMGEGWSMPTEAQFNELLSGTTNAWVTDYNGSGINGFLFTSNTNGNTLFIPAAGNGYGSSMLSVGSYGFVWSRSLYTSDPYFGRYLDFGSGYCGMNIGSRYIGFSVRGVHS